MELSVVGINYRTAPVERREQVSLSLDETRRLLRAIRAERTLDEAVVLSTCNRTEVYFVSETPIDPLPHLLAHIAAGKGSAPLKDTSVFYRHDGLAAVRHLFRVAASLDSQIVGEHEVLGQVKAAYRLALEARTARFFMNKLLHRAFRAGKRARTETGLGEGASSVPQAAVELARRLFTSLAGRTVLLIGAGETAERAARALIGAGASRLILANRTRANAEDLAARLLDPQEASGVGHQASGTRRRASGTRHRAETETTPDARCPTPEVIGLEQIASVIAGVDLVIASTRAPEPVLTVDALADPLGRLQHSLLIVDIAVPRDVEPRLGRLPNVFLYNIDDLDRLVDENLARRRQEIPRAEAIVDWEVRQFDRWMKSLDVVPTIKLLQRRLEVLRAEELARSGKRFSAGDREALERFAESLCKRILHLPLVYLHHLSGRNGAPEASEAVELVHRLFDLDSLEPDE